MTKAVDPLVVRQHERLSCRLPAKLRVREEHASQVIISRAAGDGSGGLNVTVVDCSGGGMGLEIPIFIPRSCRVQVQIFADPAAAAAAGAPAAGPLDFTFDARVQRISMTGRAPVYYLGLAFLGDAPDHTDRVQRLLAHVRQSATPPAAPAPAAVPAVRRAG